MRAFRLAGLKLVDRKKERSDVADIATVEPPYHPQGGAPSVPQETVETVSDHTRMEGMRDEWNELAGRFPTPLATHEWFMSCARAFCPPGRLHVVVLRHDGIVKAIAPLVQVNRLGIDQLEILGAAHLYEPGVILSSDDVALDRIVELIFDERKPMILQRLEPEPLAGSITNANLPKGRYVSIEHENTSPWIPVTLSWDEYEATMKSTYRSGLRRMRRRLEEQGEVRTALYTHESPDFMKALHEAFLIEACGWKGKKKTAILHHRPLRSFFVNYLHSASRQGIVRLFILTVKGKGVAMMLGIEHARRLWILKVGYDEAWRAFAPGIVLHHETIRWAFEHQLEGFEFLGSAEPFIESRWMPRLHVFRTYRLIPKSFKGVVWFCMEAGRFVMKKLDEALVTLIKKMRKVEH